jgi:hypothetical protein
VSRFSSRYIAWCIVKDVGLQTSRYGAAMQVGDWYVEPPLLSAEEGNVGAILLPGWQQLVERGDVRPFVYHSIHQLAGVGPGPRWFWLPTADDWIGLLSSRHGRQGSFRDEAARESIVLADVLEAVAGLAKRRMETDPLMAFARIWEAWTKLSPGGQG